MAWSQNAGRLDRAAARLRYLPGFCIVCCHPTAFVVDSASGPATPLAVTVPFVVRALTPACMPVTETSPVVVRASTAIPAGTSMVNDALASVDRWNRLRKLRNESVRLPW